MSGLQATLARIGQIERFVAGFQPPVPATPATPAEGAASFAQVLDSTAAVPEAAPPSTTIPWAAAPARSAADDAPLAAVSATAPAAPASPVAGADAYRPAHVTETDERHWTDCTWAAASMWIDKLTGGAIRPDREALRAASGDATGGSSLGDLVRGARRMLGLDLRAAHDERLTVRQLLDRLAEGGGAIVQGSYASLPARLTRHDPAFAAKGVAGSGHAAYVGPLDRATGRVWWDDPLAPAGATGEWISVKELKAFLWTDAHGRTYSMATPEGSDPGLTAASSAGVAGAPSAAITSAASTAGVDPLLLTAYLDIASTPRDEAALAAQAGALAAALVDEGRADRALERLGAARNAGGGTGARFASRVLREWAALLGG